MDNTEGLGQAMENAHNRDKLKSLERRIQELERVVSESLHKIANPLMQVECDLTDEEFQRAMNNVEVIRNKFEETKEHMK